MMVVYDHPWFPEYTVLNWVQHSMGVVWVQPLVAIQGGGDAKWGIGGHMKSKN